MRGKVKKTNKIVEYSKFTGRNGQLIPISDLFSNNKRYNTFDSYMKKVFNKKVVKIALDIGATCPNLDGTISTKGCSFCTGGSGDFAKSGNIVESFNSGVQLVSKKWSDCYYMPYFQSYTNTYMSVDRLKSNVDKVISLPNVVGLSIATRPDSISQDMLQYLIDLSKSTYLIVELGLQSTNDNTLKLINRGHTYSQFIECYNKLKNNGIKVCIHIVNGLINETKDDMLYTAKEVAKLNPDFLKIHLLYFAIGTIDSLRLQNGDIKPLLKEEYIDILTSQLELIGPNVVIERLTGDPDKNKLVAPKYVTDKKGMLASIDKELKNKNTYQGRLYQ